MPDLRCPKLDLMGRALIEAYRRREESLARCASPQQTAIAEDTIAELHEIIANHRVDCYLCKTKPPMPVHASETRFHVRNVA